MDEGNKERTEARRYIEQHGFRIERGRGEESGLWFLCEPDPGGARTGAGYSTLMDAAAAVRDGEAWLDEARQFLAGPRGRRGGGPPADD